MAVIPIPVPVSQQQSVPTGGCTEYTVEVDSGAFKCMTQAEYDNYRASQQITVELSAGWVWGICIGAVVLFVILCFAFRDRNTEGVW